MNADGLLVIGEAELPLTSGFLSYDPVAPPLVQTQARAQDKPPIRYELVSEARVAKIRIATFDQAAEGMDRYAD